NNNAYCQDNELAWLDWERDDDAIRLADFTARLIHFRLEHPVFHRPKFLHGKPVRGCYFKELMWFKPTGEEMTEEDWNAHFVMVLGMLVCGRTTDVRDPRGNPVQDDTFLLLFNSHHEDI